MVKKLKVGILAGSFDPVHSGHLAAAFAAVSAAQLDKVFFAVEQRPRYKQGVKSFEHRSEMVRMAIADIDIFNQLVIDHPQFSVAETIPALSSRFSSEKLHLIMGDDVAQRLASWADIETLLTQIKLVIIPRCLTPEKIKQQILLMQSVTNMRPMYIIGERTHASVSSRNIRAALKRGDAVDTLSPKVLSYIRRNRLYGSSGLGS